MLLLFVSAVGCTDIYRGTGEKYPADPRARLELRVEAAGQAERRAERAASRLRDKFAAGLVGNDLVPDIDRMELETLDFRRCMATVRDASALCDGTTALDPEIDRLQARSIELLKLLQIIRGEGAEPSPAQVQEFLRVTAPR